MLFNSNQLSCRNANEIQYYQKKKNYKKKTLLLIYLTLIKHYVCIYACVCLCV